jgi:virulence-associated protein VapD
MGSAYQDLLQHASSLGFSLPQGTCHETVQTLNDAEDLVNQQQAVSELQLRLSRLTAFQQSSFTTDKQALEARASNMSRAGDTLDTICNSKDSLADRLRSAKMRPSVPVSPDYQSDFTALLQHGIGSTLQLQEGLTALQWAASLDDKPSAWEDQLKCILDAAKELSSCLTSMEEFSSTLVDSSDTGCSSSRAITA